MGTVGLAFGSATSGTGFDVATTVASILGIQQGIETPWKTQLTALQAQDSVFSTMGTHLSALASAVQALTDFEGVTATKEGSSSDTSVLALGSASAAAVAGSHSVVVSRLAQTSSVYTSVVAHAADVLSGSISVQVGTGAAQTVSVGSDATLAGLAASINAAGVGVKASLISDASGARLSLVSGTGGAAGALTVSSALTDATAAAGVSTQVGLVGQDASLMVDGVAIASASNTVSAAIPGVTFQLLNTSAAPVQVEITNNVAGVSSAMSGLVSAYNAVVADIKGQTGKDATGAAEPLFGSPTLSLLQTQLGQALLGGAASGAISSVTQLGVTVNQDGTLTYSDSAGSAALDAHFDDVVGFLQTTGSFGLTFSQAVDGLGVDSPTGAVSLAEKQNSAVETALNKNVADEETRVAAEKVTLTAQLNLANEILQSIPSQLSEVDEMYSAVTGYNAK